jgi:hypothetical protein
MPVLDALRAVLAGPRAVPPTSTLPQQPTTITPSAKRTQTATAPGAP